MFIRSHLIEASGSSEARYVPPHLFTCCGLVGSCFDELSDFLDGLLEYPLIASTEKSKTGISFRDPLLCLALSGSRVPWLPIKIERKTA